MPMVACRALLLAGLAVLPWLTADPPAATEVSSAATADTAAADFEALRSQALSGDTMAQYHLGLTYAFGEGGAVDAPQAVAWFRKAAEQGNREAQYFLGYAYHRGAGVTADPMQ